MKYWGPSYNLKNWKMSYTDSGRTGFQIPDRWSPNNYKYVIFQEFLIWCQWSPSTRVNKLRPVAKSGTPSTFVNIVLLKHSHAHLFAYWLWLLLYYSSRYAMQLRPYAHKVKNIICPFTESFAHPSPKASINTLYMYVKGKLNDVWMDIYSRVAPNFFQLFNIYVIHWKSSQFLYKP